MKPDREKLQEVIEGARSLRDMFNALADDVAFIRDKLKNEDNQTWRRTYIRTVFALIEGVTF